MIATNKGYNKVELRWRLEHAARKYSLYRLEAAGKKILLFSGKEKNSYIDTVPVSLNLRRYSYQLKAELPEREKLENVETSVSDWCEDLLPGVRIPQRPGWERIYRKAWQLTWKSIVTSDALPSRYAYNDYPDNDTTYVWDSCFCSLFQRYAFLQSVHPCMNTIDNFYEFQQKNGHIVRNYKTRTFEPGYSVNEPVPDSVNPPLFAWAEWNFYLLSADINRLKRVLPKLIRHYEFIDAFFQKEAGLYSWSAGGSGWDNINWEQGDNEIFWYIDLFSQQALGALCISNIAGQVGDDKLKEKYRVFWAEKGKMLKRYWNEKESWYCSMTKAGGFTRKTLSGMWPMFAGIVEKKFAEKQVRNTLMNPACFLTEPMPLPALSRDESGYNPMGQYWLGGVWINMSFMVIKALYHNGFLYEAFLLAQKTLDGVYNVYANFESFPKSLWECYAPEAVSPASHKISFPDKPGGVREEFGGWTCNIINILIEIILGFSVNASENTLFWNIMLLEEHGIDNLHFGKTSTNLRVKFLRNSKKEAELIVKSSEKYLLKVKYRGQKFMFDVEKGNNRFHV